jgi:hypothetical protein
MIQTEDKINLRVAVGDLSGLCFCPSVIPNNMGAFCQHNYDISFTDSFIKMQVWNLLFQISDNVLVQNITNINTFNECEALSGKGFEKACFVF